MSDDLPTIAEDGLIVGNALQRVQSLSGHLDRVDRDRMGHPVTWDSDLTTLLRRAWDAFGRIQAAARVARPCPHCEGRGVVDGERCKPCGGVRVVAPE